MNHKDFTEAFIEKLYRTKPEIEIKKYYNREKSLILNYPYANISVEIKPNNTGVFVFWMMNFEFFDYSLLEEYWRKTLIHKDAKFILTSRCIYIYPRQRENIELCLNVLNFTTETILNTIRQINNLLIQS
jgi:hypothetical protein